MEFRGNKTIGARRYDAVFLSLMGKKINIGAYDGSARDWYGALVDAATARKIAAELVRLADEMGAGSGGIGNAQGGAAMKDPKPANLMTDAEVRALGCPFCGLAPVSYPSGDGSGLMIECHTPGCVNPHVSYTPPSAAIAAWNRRAPIRIEVITYAGHFLAACATPALTAARIAKAKADGFTGSFDTIATEVIGNE